MKKEAATETKRSAKTKRKVQSSTKQTEKIQTEGASKASGSTEKPKLPVTVLSGFLGAGKTTLLKHILRTAGNDTNPMRIALVVNDMGEINLDASEIKVSKLMQVDATMVEMTNGCICCTLRGDLLKTVKALSQEKSFDYLLIESTGISEPLPVAQTFVMDVDGDGSENEGSDDTKMSDTPSSETEGDRGKRSAGRKKVDTAAVRSLSHFARLDTLVTVVDALNIYDVLSSLETLAEENSSKMVGNTGIAGQNEGGDRRGAAKNDNESSQEEKPDERSIAQLWLDQIEFANVIILSKAHLLGTQAAGTQSSLDGKHTNSTKRRTKTKQHTAQGGGGASETPNEAAVRELEALIRRLNPKARVIVPRKPKFADVQMRDLVHTELFDMEEAQESAGWQLELKKEAEGVGHTPETEEYGVGSVVFRNTERPFHPGRLHAIMQGFGNYKSCAARGASGAAGRKDTSGPTDGVFNGLVRAKGALWIASAHAYPVDLQVAGRCVDLNPREMPYLAAVPEEEWDEDDENQYGDLVCAGLWDDTNGDRATEAVFIGVHLDEKGMLQALEDALLTDAELEGGVEAWREWEDPFWEGEYLELSPQEEEEEEEEGGGDDEDDESDEEREQEVGKKRKAQAAVKPRGMASQQAATEPGGKKTWTAKGDKSAKKASREGAKGQKKKDKGKGKKETSKAAVEPANKEAGSKKGSKKAKRS